MHDVRISLRSLLRAPMLALTIILTVGLGIGATAAIFSAVNAALLRPLPYHEPERLVRIYTDTPPFKFRFSLADYLTLEEQQTQLEQLAAYTDRTMSFTDGSVAELLRARIVTWTFFSLLGLEPAVGRDFTDADGARGSPPTAIASHAFWQQRLGGRTGAIGTSIRLDGTDYLLVGVLPPTHGPLERRQDVFVVAQFSPPPRKGPFLYTVIARLKMGSAPSAVADELRAINARMFPLWRASYQDDKATWGMTDLQTFVVGDLNAVAGAALAAVVLVWLIASANASNLLIARVTSRRREIAVRTALGASRQRVLRFLLTESALLAVAALLIGCGIAAAGTMLLRVVGANYFPRMQEVQLDAPVVGVMAALTLFSGLIFGLVPAWHATASSNDGGLRGDSRSATGGVDMRRLRRLLVGAQFAMSTPLLIVAALLLVSLSHLKHVDLGFDGRNVLTGTVRLPSALYADPARVAAFWEELRRRLGALPGVAGVSFADGRPPRDVGNLNNFDLEEFPTPAGQSQPTTPWIAVSPEFVGVLGLSLVEGRLLDERDAQRPNLEAVMVDRVWARRFFPGQSAIGKRFREGGCTSCPWTAVVGVVSEVKYVGLDQSDQGTVYAPLSGSSLSRYVLIRTLTDPGTVSLAVRRTIHELEAGAPWSNVATIDELVAQSLERPQSLSILIGSVGLVALVLSVIGIFGVMAYYVQQHVREIGIRIALGGSSRDVLRLVLGQGLAVVAGGVVVGLLVSLSITRLVSSLLFGVNATHATTFAGVGALLLSTATLACALPAVRAIRVQPAVVLRNE